VLSLGFKLSGKSLPAAIVTALVALQCWFRRSFYFAIERQSLKWTDALKTPRSDASSPALEERPAVHLSAE